MYMYHDHIQYMYKHHPKNKTGHAQHNTQKQDTPYWTPTRQNIHLIATHICFMIQHVYELRFVYFDIQSNMVIYYFSPKLSCRCLSLNHLVARFLMLVDCDSGTLGFGAENVYWGNHIKLDKSKYPVYPLLGTAFHNGFVSMVYIGSGMCVIIVPLMYIAIFILMISRGTCRYRSSVVVVITTTTTTTTTLLTSTAYTYS